VRLTTFRSAPHSSQLRESPRRRRLRPRQFPRRIQDTAPYNSSPIYSYTKLISGCQEQKFRRALRACLRLVVADNAFESQVQKHLRPVRELVLLDELQHFETLTSGHRSA